MAVLFAGYNLAIIPSEVKSEYIIQVYVYTVRMGVGPWKMEMNKLASAAKKMKMSKKINDQA